MTEPVLLKRYDRAHNITVDELVDWCLHHNLDPGQVTVYANLTYHSPETAEEVAARAEWLARKESRHVEWERETYERLKVKFGDG